MCFALRRHDDARAAIDKALALKPYSPQAWLVLGNILSAQGSHYEALAAYDKSLALDPQMADAWRGRASVLTAQNRHPEAVAAYDKLLAIRPDAEYAQGARLLARMQVCDWADWTGECERILAGVRQDDTGRQPIRAAGRSSHRVRSGQMCPGLCRRASSGCIAAGLAGREVPPRKDQRRLYFVGFSRPPGFPPAGGPDRAP